MALVVWLLVVVLNPFGTKDFATAASVRVFAQLVAPWYGDGKPRAQDGIIVVMLTEKAQSAYGHFPLAVDEYGQILEEILADGPDAVFVDVGFKRMHRNGNAVVDIVGWLANENWPAPKRPVPLVFASGGPDDDAPSLVPPAVRRRASPRFVVDHAVTLLDKDVSLYPLTEAESGSRGVRHETAAFRIFSLTCGETRTDCPAQHPDLYRETMAVQWGLRPPPTRRFDTTCLSAGHHWTGHLWTSSAWLVHQAASGILAPLVQRCPYTVVGQFEPR